MTGYPSLTWLMRNYWNNEHQFIEWKIKYRGYGYTILTTGRSLYGCMYIQMK